MAARSTGRWCRGSPGSALKPFTYALAFEQGRGPASVLPDIPTHFPTAEPGVLYSPRNYDGRYHGPLLARRALAGSQNVPAVALASDARRQRAAAVPLARRTVHIRPPAGVLRPRADARATRKSGSTNSSPPTRHSRAAGCGASRRFFFREVRSFRLRRKRDASVAADRVSGSPTSSAIPRRARMRSGAAAISISRSRSRSRPARRRRITTTGRSGTRATSPSACGSATSIGTPLRNSSGVTGAGPIFHAVMLAATKGRESLRRPRDSSRRRRVSSR